MMAGAVLTVLPVVRRVRRPAALLHRGHHGRGGEGMSGVTAGRWTGRRAVRGIVVAARRSRGRRWRRAAAADQVLDDFEDLERLDGDRVRRARGRARAATPATTGMAMRIDFDFAAAAATSSCARRSRCRCRANYAFTLPVRGEAPPNDFEFKLVDASGRTCGGSQRTTSRFPNDWQKLTIKKRASSFAWGPRAAPTPRKIACDRVRHRGRARAAADRSGSTTSVSRSASRASAATSRRKVTASTRVAGHEPRACSTTTPADRAGRAAARAAEQWLQLDFHQRREYGGLVIDWDPEDYAIALRRRGLRRRTDLDHAYSSTHRQRRPRLRLPARRRVALHPAGAARRAAAARATRSPRSR